MAFDQFGFPDISDGPDRFRGGPNCPSHHDGVRTGISDTCCCCNPCLYDRSPFTLPGNVGDSPWDLRGSCCRCYPKAICMTFTPDPGTASACCQEFGYTAFPEHFPEYTKYTFEFAGSEFTISIDPSMDYEISEEFNLGPCYWNLSWPDMGVYETLEIDHNDVTCLEVPNWLISGLSDSAGCPGSISFSEYSGNKIPFTNILFDDPREADVAATSSPCECESVSRLLCVSGIRHSGGSQESVQFVWNADLGDRWEYLPPCGNPTTEREIIYLRSDEYGNCYLELDFEQSGSSTNDWADPPNTFDALDPTNIRSGMVAMNSCSCGLLIKTTSTGSRSITITSGPCSRFKYLCDDCRCAPSTLCLFGEIDGVTITEETVQWDSTTRTWTGVVGGFNITIGIKNGSCDDCSTGACDNCVGYATGNFVTPFADSVSPALCGPFLSFELASEYDEAYPDMYNWLWVTAGVCGCLKQKCGICAEERCGGPPRILYYDYSGLRRAPPGGGYDETCTMSMVLHYWERWSNSGPTPVLECGYYGQTVVQCEPDSYLYSVSIPPSRVMVQTRTNLTTGAAIATTMSTFDPQSCDPLVYTSPAFGNVTSICGCDVVGITESQIVISE